MSDDEMDVDQVLTLLNAALRLQQRSALQLSLAAGGLTGLAGQALAPRLAASAAEELGDARRLVEKIVALGGDPTDEVAPLAWHEDALDMVGALVRQEEEAVAALHAVIPPTGQEPRSEALEHLVEHLIMRKQGQVDMLLRVLRGAGGPA
ncbi:ferritin-like domain-containing protein [Miltoncostaea oceani]|jgi:bacterioferritin (cytochrome b1)|uniref:ferritin-like domain-containing protein n=1 Tax=Miltoncostaea oceani TaxID=2843216 RepID=UPI001C3C6260|nr:ferritin-like domain-containing protein [Miltoncostaea oceani]